MTQFDLSLWLQDKSRKVVARDGKSVRIVCTDGPDKYYPIVGFIDESISAYMWDLNGRYGISGEDNNDLFFADEEEELTEFEKEIENLFYCTIHPTTNAIKEKARQLLDLARKELQQEFKEEYDRGYSIGKFDAGEAKVKELVAEFEKGRQDALKDLPKWKKATENKDLEKHIAILEEDKVLLSNYLEKEDYYIDLEDLKTLPKEE